MKIDIIAAKTQSSETHLKAFLVRRNGIGPSSSAEVAISQRLQSVYFLDAHTEAFGAHVVVVHLQRSKQCSGSFVKLSRKEKHQAFA